MYIDIIHLSPEIFFTHDSTSLSGIWYECENEGFFKLKSMNFIKKYIDKKCVVL